MSERLAGFKGEYLWELDIAEHHLRAIVEAIPGERYDWRPADNSRSVSQVIVHVAAGNFALLDMVGVQAPPDVYPPVAAQGADRFFALVLQNQALGQRVRAKADVTKMLATSLAVVRDAFTRTTGDELERHGTFFGEQTTVRRVYLRLLAHAHEHMGQLIAYVRAMGMSAPWPDPMDIVKSQVGQNAGAAGSARP